LTLELDFKGLRLRAGKERVRKKEKKGNGKVKEVKRVRGRESSLLHIPSTMSFMLIC